MYENNYAKNTYYAPRAKEVAMRVRQQEKEMALLKAEYKAEFTPIRGRSATPFTGIVYGLLSIFGLK